MRREDFKEFAELLDAAFDLIGKTPAAKIISPTSKALFFQALAEYPLPAVRGALGEHIKRGEFTPTPAAIIKLLEAAGDADTRPGPEEAWAIALASQDERDTVVWTAETAEALQIARPVLESSGPISGRKTFIEAYSRLVEAARQAKRPAQWSAHLGWDKSQQAAVLQRAVDRGLLPAPKVTALLPPPEVPELALSGDARDQLAKVKQMLADGAAQRDKRLQDAADARNETEAQFRRDLNERVRQYQAYIRTADRAQVTRAEGERVEQAGQP
jgi:hypothetical protein